LTTVGIGDIERLFPNPHTSIGVLGSLVKKGLVTYYGAKANEKYNVYCATKKARELLGMKLHG
jgi:hypothetical protein